ncbi:hypothetical protein B5P62_23445 [Salmonella enterica]|nr:hypothetical protein [Salmonella enterica]
MLPVILFGVGINCYAHEALPVIKTNELKKLGVTDKHYQSYNIEMIELTGGWFWKPYGEKGYKTTPDTKKNIPQGMNPDAYQYIPPVNLNNEKLITLAKALSPAYIRVSGTWANSTYFSPDGKITTPPHGFNNVLTGKQWASLVNFSNTVGSPIPIWVTETGESACGGNPWAGTFLDTFRYTDQLGRLARKGVSVVAHNTLAVSDYSLLDEKNYNPKPDYWAALLWSKLMGNVVLDTPSTSPDLHLYAQCLKNSPGGVTLLALNINNNAFSVKLDKPVDIYQLSADGNINKSSVLLNGNKLQLTSDNRIPHLSPLKNEGRVIIPARSIVFMAVKKAHNPYCY